MIKLFRNIRQNLLNEGKTTKYFKYAIGEIILVMIGILLALQVNNWNQERNENKLGRSYLERIHRDLILDTLNFRKKIESNNAIRVEIKDALEDLNNQVDSFEEVTHICAVFGRALDQVFIPKDNTYKGMVSSGNLTLIKNTALIEAITNLYSDYDTKSKLFYANKEWMDAISIHLDSYTDLVKFSEYTMDIYPVPGMLNKSDYEFLNHPEDEKFKIVIRAMSACAWNQKAANDYYSELLIHCKETLKLIDQELKNQSH
ncbi:DUF6090 family protein [Formosa maritima]|uniref:Uncharacterized protein n=1 Tax=Formosa maritima TaxID=2592046 RepID=A0A5D0GGR9_9FLAO|nr:DUF6090 family protein [Formosa maritima]TYA57509.1 hypothetical protein FVF61_04585 [Formosa maritima]